MNKETVKYILDFLLLATYKIMNEYIIKCGIIGKHRYNFCHVITTTTKHAVKTTVMTTETTQHTLQHFTVKCPIAAMFVHIVFKHGSRLHPERVKVLSATPFVHVDGDPVSSGFVVGIRIADE